jgi:hypothetical protein
MSQVQIVRFMVEAKLNRDPDFDLESDRRRCLHGLGISEAYAPSDVQRVTELFEDAEFYTNSPYSNEIIQGQCADCWFISALTATSMVEGLAQKYCVAVSPIVVFPSRVRPSKYF